MSHTLLPTADSQRCLQTLPNVPGWEVGGHNHWGRAPNLLQILIFSSNTCASVLSHFSHVQLCATLWTVAHQAPLSMGLSRQESWSGLPCPSSRDFLIRGLNPCLLHLLQWQVGSFPLAPPGKPISNTYIPPIPFSCLITSAGTLSVRWQIHGPPAMVAHAHQTPEPITALFLVRW